MTTTITQRNRRDATDPQDDVPRGEAPPTPVLRLTPYAWAKLLFLRDAGETEVGGFGITAPDDCLLIEDVRLVRQRCTLMTVELADEAVADFFDEQVDLGRRPQQFARIWLHTHPGDSAEPSGTDEATFARCFGRADWAVMFILAQGGETYARLRLTGGPGAELCVPVAVEYAAPFPASDQAAWRQEYEDCVERRQLRATPAARRRLPDELELLEIHPERFDVWEQRLSAAVPTERSPYDDDNWS